MFTIQVWSIQTPDLSLIFRWLLYTACLTSLGIIHKWRHAQLAFFWLFVIVKRLLTHFNKYNDTTPCVTSFFNVPLPNNVMKDETIKWKSINLPALLWAGIFCNVGVDRVGLVGTLFLFLAEDSSTRTRICSSSCRIWAWTWSKNKQFYFSLSAKY